MTDFVPPTPFKQGLVVLKDNRPYVVLTADMLCLHADAVLVAPIFLKESPRVLYAGDVLYSDGHDAYAIGIRETRLYHKDKLTIFLDSDTKTVALPQDVVRSVKQALLDRAHPTQGKLYPEDERGLGFGRVLCFDNVLYNHDGLRGPLTLLSISTPEEIAATGTVQGYKAQHRPPINPSKNIVSVSVGEPPYSRDLWVTPHKLITISLDGAMVRSVDYLSDPMGSLQYIRDILKAKMDDGIYQRSPLARNNLANNGKFLRGHHRITFG